jgi:hypothetical protein
VITKSDCLANGADAIREILDASTCAVDFQTMRRESFEYFRPMYVCMTIALSLRLEVLNAESSSNQSPNVVGPGRHGEFRNME